MTSANPKGRNAIRTADPILRQLFQITRERGLGNADVAKLINRSENTIINWRRGNSSPAMIDIVILADALGCKISVAEKSDNG